MKAFVSRLKEKVFHDDIVGQSAALSYYTALAMAPIVILLLRCMSVLGLKLQQQLTLELKNLVGPDAAQSFATIVEKTQERPDIGSLATWSSAIVLVISASIVFAQLQSALNLIFEAEYKAPLSQSTWADIRQFIMRRLICIGMVLNFIFISIVSLVVSAGLAFLENPELHWFGKLLQTIGNFFVFSLLFAAIYQWMPDKRIRWHANWRGGVITALLFVLGKLGISLYLSHTAVGSAYGAAGSLVVLLVWVYYSSLIFYFGAEIAAVLTPA